ncbi:LytTR family DNA-binding domain-containing protein [Halosquirtibacter xylanolyticus]|uniref:LytR/AlgR family response regulator transcription factor n=1 Tax=Halosquirtibacter xylanolyticus TaxID=3374599 RepID=UPI0037487340|nr:LytTR family DNA-binding domain-containing protein [Prolixibacteraceae bacterium]
MKKTRCLIVDDEILALEVIEAYINRLNNLELVDKCHSAIEALSILNSTKIDLLFLDIQMPGLTGIQLLRNLSNPPKVIFTTAYSEYAVESYDLEALDYLIKPIPFDRFIKAVNRFFKQNNSSFNIPETAPSLDTENPFIFVKSDKRMVKITLNQIEYIESIRNNVSIFLENGEEVVTPNTISNIEEKLPEMNFIRVHRSFIVSISKIESYTAANIRIKNHVIPIGRNYKVSVLKILDHNAIE